MLREIAELKEQKTIDMEHMKYLFREHKDQIAQ